jgi:hypothetical protein
MLAATVVFAVSLTHVDATTTVCPERAWKHFAYGEKRKIQFVFTGNQRAALTKELVAYASRKQLVYGGAGLTDPSKSPVYNSNTDILQSRSLDIAIRVHTTNLTHIATADISTFSFSCTATEDWRPYWRDLLRFIGAKGYKQIR